MAVAVVLALAACGTAPPAPVVKRTTPSGAAPPKSDLYTVVRGDTLFGIAIRNGVTVTDLRRWNGLDAEDILQAGQVLRVTPPPSAVAAAPAPVAVPTPAPVAPPGPVAGTGTVVPASPQTGTVTGRSIDARQLDQGAAPATAPEATGPLGFKQPFSQSTFEQVARANAGVGTQAPAPAPATAPSTAPQTQAAIPAPAPAPAPAQSPAQSPAAAPAPDNAAAPVSSAGWSWPSSGPMLRGFGDTSQKGIEIAGRIGDPVFAAAPGRVIFAGVGPRGYGNLIIIKHDQDVLSVYAHNSKVLVKEGQDVARGQRVAEVGDSDADRPKLHFEVRRGGRPVDPVAFLPKR